MNRSMDEIVNEIVSMNHPDVDPWIVTPELFDEFMDAWMHRSFLEDLHPKKLPLSDLSDIRVYDHRLSIPNGTVKARGIMRPGTKLSVECLSDGSIFYEAENGENKVKGQIVSYLYNFGFVVIPEDAIREAIDDVQRCDEVGHESQG